MILIFEQDTRDSFEWVPELYLGIFNKRKTWRFVWGWWSISQYSALGLMEFMNLVKGASLSWRGND